MSTPWARAVRDRRRLWIAVAVALLMASAVVWIAPSILRPAPGSWDELLAPYSRGAPLLDEFRVAAVRRGAARDVIVEIVDAEGRLAAEVHVLPRGVWSGVRESESFAIAYETPRSPSARRDDITELLAETVRARDRGLPAPDLIPLSSGLDATLLPRWLGAASGWPAVAVGASMFALGLLTLAPTSVTAAAGALVGAAGLVLAAVDPPDGGLDAFGPWAVPAAFALLWMGSRRRRVVAAEWIWAAAVTAIALLLRLLLGAWGPMHVNGYGPRFVAGATVDPAAIAAYGPGYAELFGPVAALAPAQPDWAIFAANAVLSAFAVTLAFALGRRLGMERRAAFAAGLLLAVDPIAIRTAATESYVPLVAFLCAAAAIALVEAGEAFAARAGARAVGCTTAAGLLLIAAARIHPAAWLPVAVALLFAGAGRSDGLRIRATALAAAAVTIGGLALATSGDALLDVYSNVRSGVLMQPPRPHSLQPLVWPAGLVVACAAAGGAGRRIAIAAAAALAAMLLTRHLYGQSWIWQQSYDRLFLAVPVLAVVGGVLAPLWRRPAVFAAIAVCVTAAWFRYATPIVAARTTDHLEYRWLRERLRDIPTECRVIHVASSGDRGVEIPTYVRGARAPSVAIQSRSPQTLDAALAPVECLYYVRTSLCSSAEARDRCDTFEKQLRMEIVERTSFPAAPSSPLIPYDRDPVEVWLARASSKPPK